MGKDDDVDTDPASPRARARTSEPAAAAAPASPPSPPQPAVPRPSRTPSAAGPNDSIDTLLGGIPQKTTDAAAGVENAAYRAEHRAPPARSLREDEPKVVVDRQALSQTVRILRPVAPKVQLSPEVAAAELDTTASVGPNVGARVALALLAALAVVAGLFIALKGKMGAGTAPTETRASAAPVLPSSAPPTPAAPSPAASSAMTSAAAPGSTAPRDAERPSDRPNAVVAAPANAANAANAASSASSASSVSSGRAKPRGAASSDEAADGDLGEFKTKFH